MLSKDSFLEYYIRMVLQNDLADCLLTMPHIKLPHHAPQNAHI
jgi:hypothetical protein